MRRLLALLSMFVLAFPTLAAPVTLPTWRDVAGQLHQAEGFVFLNADGSLATLGTGGSGGDASAANQTLEIAKGEQIRALLAAPLAVTQSGSWTIAGITNPVAVTGTFWQAVQPISATALPLPSGASTSANQATEIASLGTIATNSGTQSTAAKQDTGNTALSTIASNTAGIPTGSPVRTFDETNAIAGRGFTWGTGVQAVGAGTYLNVVFSNPSGSGKTAYIVLREFSQSTANVLQASIRFNCTPLANMTAVSGGNRLMGSATTSVATLSYLMSTSQITTGTAGAAQFIEPNGHVVDSTLMRIVPPGYNFCYVVAGTGGGLTAAASISVTFAGWEQ